MGLFWLVMGHVFHMISYVDCDVDCDMDSYMPGGGGMLTTDIEASRWSNIYDIIIETHTSSNHLIAETFVERLYASLS